MCQDLAAPCPSEAHRGLVRLTATFEAYHGPQSHVAVTRGPQPLYIATGAPLLPKTMGFRCFPATGITLPVATAAKALCLLSSSF